MKHKNHQKAFWTAEEIDYSADLEDWDTLSSNEKYDRIVTMDLSNLKLEYLPATIKDLANLEELDLSSNLFSNLPSELCTVANQLNTLKIEKNLLCDPTSITHCVLEVPDVEFMV